MSAPKCPELQMDKEERRFRETLLEVKLSIEAQQKGLRDLLLILAEKHGIDVRVRR